MRRYWRRITSVDGFWWMALAGALLVLGLVLSWLFWKDLHGDDESLSATVRNLGLVLGGVIAVVLAVWRSKVAERQAETAQEGLRNERYQTGAKMLGNTVLSVRLGGIYALQRLAEEHAADYHVQIMRLFCGFVRNLEPSGAGKDEPIREDAQAIMEAIAACHERNRDVERKAGFRLDLRGAQLLRAFLSDLNLSNANFNGAHLSNANLMGANLYHAMLLMANLTGANLVGANLSKAWLAGGDLSGARLHSANLSDARLSGANFSRANLSEATLVCAELFEADFSNAILFRAKLPGADLTGAKLPHASLTEANLSGAILKDASLRHAELAGPNMSGADLSRADLSGARFTTLTRYGTEDRRSHPATGLTQSQLDEARADEGNGPDLEGVVDAETGEPLVWRGGSR